MKAGRAPVPLELEDMPLPLNTFKNKSPFTGKVKSVERIVGPNATGETCHIIIEHGGKMPFWEGQSYGVIPPAPRSTPRARRSPTASASTPSPPPVTVMSSTARPPPSASAAPPTGTPR